MKVSHHMCFNKLLGKVCRVMLEITVMHLKTNNHIIPHFAKVKKLW